MMNALLTILGKMVRVVSRLFGNNGASLPGYVIETIDNGYLARMLNQLPRGVIVVTGTNGKTTTTKMIAEALQSAGMTVLTNSTGSNFTRGVISMIATRASAMGKLSADIAVLELDEAYAVHFCEAYAPRGAVLLNVMRDQLDRFGEIDTTARLLQSVAEKTKEFVVLNASDERVSKINVPAGAQTYWFGVDSKLAKLFPSDDQMYDADNKRTKSTNPPKNSVSLAELKDHKATYYSLEGEISAELNATGPHNALNAAAAISALKAVLPEESIKQLTEYVSKVAPAFGRGEEVEINGATIQLQLVKNPAGFSHSMRELERDTPDAIMICINDNYADSRDVSWLWDVDFRPITMLDAKYVFTSGSRAYDMALRLKYDDVDVTTDNIDTEIEKQLHALLHHVENSGRQKVVIYCTYTAMWFLHNLFVKREYKEPAR